MLAVPLYDDSPRIQPPIITYGLIAACSVAFLWQLGQGPRAANEIALAYGMVPAILFGNAELPAQLRMVPPWATLLTSMFLHGGWLHLLGNMLYLWIFGKGVETALGAFRYLMLYLAGGVVAALTQGAVDPEATAPMIGASGAIAGVLGAYLVLYPRGNVVTFIWIFVFVRVVTVPAVLMLGLWFLLQLVSALSAATGEPGVAFWAHVGGFVTGLLLVTILRRTGVAMLQPPRTTSFMSVRPQDARRSLGLPPVDGRRERRGPWG
ncbi:MAG TPA: rhomboid family intramembrane serine protease [Stellaceae bacterium]|nr:rhomboid family intramembrane serine protease [Stellaceae bacterium]